MNEWIVKKYKNINFKNPLMIEGLPGMGNVGKITVDFIIESVKAVKVYEIFSSNFPNCVFVNEKGLTDLPKIEIYHKTIKGRDLFLVSGDMQPVTEKGCYDLADKILDIFQEFKGTEIITLGGIGLEEIPKTPKVYCAGSDKLFLSQFTKKGIKTAEGIVGPVIGVSGLLVGLGRLRKIKGAILLVETLGAPTYLGVKEASELLKVLDSSFKMKLDLKSLNKEVKVLEHQLNERLKKFIKHEESKLKAGEEFTNYIG